MTRRKQVELAVATGIALAFWFSGMHSKATAELAHTEAGMFRLMPGIVFGLLIGFFFDNELITFVVTIAVNVWFYYFVLQSISWIWRKMTKAKI